VRCAQAALNFFPPRQLAWDGAPGLSRHEPLGRVIRVGAALAPGFSAHAPRSGRAASERLPTRRAVRHWDDGPRVERAAALTRDDPCRITRKWSRRALERPSARGSAGADEAEKEE
jgi:hypothetical protein